jgi:hypothetical protein
MLLLMYGVIQLEHPGDGAAGTLVTFAAGLALLVAFVVIERRSADPLVRLGILRSGPLVRANLGALLFVGSFAGFQFVATLYLQEVRGWSTLQTGLAMLMIGLDTILAPTLTPRLVNRFGNARVLFGGLVVAVVAYALLLPVGMDWTYTAMLPTMLLLGVAFSLAYGPLTMAATDGIAEHEHGLASGLLYRVRPRCSGLQAGGVELVKRTRAQVARLELSAAQVAVLDGQAHTARALWNLLHEYATFRQGRLATLKQCDDAIRAARHEIDWMRHLPARSAKRQPPRAA